ncbi:hypothetical protein F1559_004695 [Cyanidiococcus yangmingshanensis]|uniref:Uncharacterized protein n=1 Tax=Cyanidiococcus yangmingshanensis TaxID=2690220 RepID=A0A7J7IML9_9RHOD|nr:hypothetical protein F1559_004695 [Cyanidiococcus yangmingshanensis]
MSHSAPKGAAPLEVGDREAAGAGVLAGGDQTKMSRAVGVASRAENGARAQLRMRQFKGRKQRSSFVGFGTSPVTPTGNRYGRQSATACGGTRRYRQFVNELYLRMSAAHHGSFGGLSTEALDSPLETLDWGVERPQTAAAWLREFWSEVRERLPHSPPLEQILRGSGDAWSLWEPFRECTEEEEATMLAALRTFAAGPEKHNTKQPTTAWEHAAKRGCKPDIDELCSKISRLPLDGALDEVDQFDADEFEIRETSTRPPSDAKQRTVNMDPKEDNLFSFDEDFERTLSTSTVATGNSMQAEISNAILAFFRLEYATRSLLRRHADKLWLLVALYESLWYEHGLLPHLDRNRFVSLQREKQGSPMRLLDAIGNSPERVQVAAQIRSVSVTATGAVSMTLGAMSRLHRRVIQGIAAYHGLDWGPVPRDELAHLDDTTFETGVEADHPQQWIRLVCGGHRAPVVSVPLSSIVCCFPSCDANVHQAVRRCLEWQTPEKTPAANL